MARRARGDRGAGSTVAARATAAAGAALVALALVAAPAQGQRREEPRLSVELFGGVASYSRFVEQVAVSPLDGLQQRELTGSTGPAVGGTVGLYPKLWGIDDLAVQLGFQWTSSDFQFENDDPAFDDDFGDDEEQAGEFQTATGSISVVKFLGDPDRTLAPYAIAGVSGTWWFLDEGAGGGIGAVTPTLDGDDTLFRIGGVAGLGLQFRAADALALRLEYTRYEIRSPFDGDGEDAFGITTGQTFDEPNRVGANRLSLGLAYTLFKDTDRHHRRRR